MILDELEIKRLSNKYQFKRCELFGDELYIESKKGSWRIKVGGKKGLELWHRNEYDTKTRWHKQKDFYDIPFIFKSIADHDKFKLKKQYIKPCKTTMMFAQIAK